MGQAQDFVIKLLGLGLVVAGGFAILRGAFGVHKTSNAGNDDIHIAGWKTLTSWWALGGIILAGGSYMTFARFFNGIFQYLFG